MWQHAFVALPRFTSWCIACALLFACACDQETDDEDSGATVAVPAAPEPETEPVRLSALGESCTRTADCVEGSKCMNLTCVDANARPEPEPKPEPEQQRPTPKEWAYHCGPIAYRYPSQSHCTRNYEATASKPGKKCSPCQLIDAR
jgi:hypothetical protein